MFEGVDYPITLHHWNMLMQAYVLEHSLSFEWFSFPSTPSTLAAKIYILSHRDKNSVNISLRTSGSTLSSPALSWLCGGWRALIVTTAARSSSKQPLNCHQTEFWMSVLFFPLLFFLSSLKKNKSWTSVKTSGSASVLSALENILKKRGRKESRNIVRKKKITLKESTVQNLAEHWFIWEVFV